MANKVYKIDETSTVFGDEAGDDVSFTTASSTLSSGAGRQSSQLDLGAGTTARSRLFFWRAYCQAVATPTVGNALEVYLKMSDGTHADNDDGTSDAAVSAQDKLRNLERIGTVQCDEAAANIEFSAHGMVEINERYVQVVWWNALGSALTSDDTESKFVLTPSPDQVQ